MPRNWQLSPVVHHPRSPSRGSVATVSDEEMDSRTPLFTVVRCGLFAVGAVLGIACVLAMNLAALGLWPW